MVIIGWCFMKEENKNVLNTDFEILWTGKPAGLWQRFLTTLNLNFTTYQKIQNITGIEITGKTTKTVKGEKDEKFNY